jgi:hypothetical protein
MTPVWVAIAVIFAVGLSILFFGTAIVFWYLILQMRKLQAAADRAVKAVEEVVAEGSMIRVSRSLTVISGSLPEMLQTFHNLAGVIKTFSSLMIAPEKPEKRSPEVGAGESGFYEYSEAKAAEFEAITNANKEKLTLTDEQLATFRTEPAQVPPLPES